MNYVSLFTGIGGFDLAFNRAGHHCVAMVERDKAAQAVLRARFPGVPLFDDVIKFGRKDIDGPVDIVVGGSPCQSFSVAGLRKSLGDDRGNLAFEFCRIVSEFNPRWVVWENVPGVLSTKDNAFGNFLAALVGEDSAIVPTRGKWTNAGLVAGPERTAAWRVLDAQYFGVAQRRRRVFVVAGTGAECVTPVLFESEGVRRDSPPRRETRQGVAGFAPPRASADVSAALSASGRGTSRTGESRVQDVLVVNPIVVKTDNTQSNGWGVLEDGTTHTLGGATDAVVYGDTGAVQLTGDRADPSVTVYEDVSPTLPANPMSDRGIAVYDARGNGDGTVAPNITGDHNAKIGDYTAVVIEPRYYTRDNKTGGAPSDVASITNAHKAGDSAPVVIQQNTRDEVRLVNGDGQIAGALSSQAGMKQQNYVVQGFDRTRGTESGDIAAPLRANNASGDGVNDGKADNQCVVIAPSTSPALKSEGADSSEDGTGRHALIVRSTGAGWYTADDKASLRAQPGGTTFDIVVQQNAVGVDGQDAKTQLVVAFSAIDNARDAAENVSPTVRHNNSLAVATDVVAFMAGQGAKAGGVGASEDTAPTLKSSPSGLNSSPSIALGSATVRRLTPTECERLQAFPDGWTLRAKKPGDYKLRAIYSVPETLGDEAEIIGWTDYDQADTPRYKQLGNAVCVNVVEWIARRIP